MEGDAEELGGGSTRRRAETDAPYLWEAGGGACFLGCNPVHTTFAEWAEGRGEGASGQVFSVQSSVFSERGFVSGWAGKPVSGRNGRNAECARRRLPLARQGVRNGRRIRSVQFSFSSEAQTISASLRANTWRLAKAGGA
jgi:hypothetical protein